MLSGTAEIVRSGPLFDEAHDKIRAKYGAQIPIVRRIRSDDGAVQGRQTFRDPIVLIALDPE